ncbi:MAG: hypothetical protein WCA08_17950 [Desulfoferrobacter sp.]
MIPKECKRLAEVELLRSKNGKGFMRVRETAIEPTMESVELIGCCNRKQQQIKYLYAKQLAEFLRTS